MEFFTKKTSSEKAGDNVQSSQSTNKLISRQESFSQVFDISIFEVKDGMVNLTKVCQYFGKEFSNWNKTKNTKEFLKEFALENPDLPNGGIAILKGGNGEQGTFAVREISLELARWISPKFAVWANKQIDTLLQTGKVELQPQPKTSLTINADFLEQVAKKMRQLEEDKEKLATQNKRLIHSGKLYTATEIAKELNLKSAIQLNKILEDNKLQYKCNNTWVLVSKYADKQYTDIKQVVLENGKIVYDRVFTGLGRDWLLENQTKILSRELVKA
jgi:hypothetical protein